ncbi:ATP-grasp domain-containing protein [Candidatus Woesearchaeota archaeon]|nr:ATP-grasp domain-containing protein [Candidatus Woesearchaeota archaeon]
MKNLISLTYKFILGIHFYSIKCTIFIQWLVTIFFEKFFIFQRSKLDVKTNLKHLRMGIITSGESVERGVSLRQGKRICYKMKLMGLNVKIIDFNRSFFNNIKQNKINCCFIISSLDHKIDGSVQSILNMLEIPYLGSNIESTMMGFDKYLSNVLLEKNNVLTPKYYKLSKYDFLNKKFDNFDLKFPLIIKPVHSSSSMGVYFVETFFKLKFFLKKSFMYEDNVLIEEFVKGRELSIGVLGNNEPSALSIIEVQKSSNKSFFSTYSKHLEKYDSVKVFHSNIDVDLYKKVQSLALKIHRLVGCQVLSRIDFIIDKNEKIFFLEINTLPSIFEKSIFTLSAKYSNVSYEDLILKLIRLSLKKN